MPSIIAPVINGASIPCTTSRMDNRIPSKAYPFHLHAGVRGSPPSVRLVRRESRHLPPAADRIRPLEFNLHASKQAQAALAGPAEAGQRMERSAHANDQRNASSRLYSGGPAKF